MKDTNYTDQEVVSMIVSSTDNRNKALKEVYMSQKLRLSVKKAVAKMGAQDSDIKDTYQDAIVIFDRNVRNGKFRGDSTIVTYITGIAKWLWLGQQRKLRRMKSTDQIEIYDGIEDSNAEELVEVEERKHHLRRLLDKMDDKCNGLLKMYMLNLSMKEIAEKRGFTKVQSAKNAVHRCREKLRTIIKNSSFDELLKV